MQPVTDRRKQKGRKRRFRPRNLRLVPDDASKIGYGWPTVIVGLNVLRELHLYIAYGEHVIYVTPASAH